MKSKRIDNVGSWWYSWYTAVFFAVVCIFMARSVWSLVSVYQKQDTLLARATLDLTRMQVKVSEAKTRNQEIYTNQGMEQYVREAYPVAAPGEHVIIIEEPEKEWLSQVRSDMTLQEHVYVYLGKIFGEE